ncbi:Redoxin [Pirellulimonas nuda]|uniref:Redoxin n=1 Tax=Pirellulimonas nuda TaxID=2528009 RepID=A0A518D8E3_9BACT|nr:redoxin family protein [Pirellulimonas nuda]QDU87756.1 Redoxin [Pirellulimonas nuda]
MSHHTLRLTALLFCVATPTSAALAQPAAPTKTNPTPPKVGDEAPSFKLLPYNAKPGPQSDESLVELAGLLEQGPVVLVVLRGYPGYQCPACSAQVAQFVAKADALGKAGASVVMVYPGPKNELAMRASEFVGDTKLPKSFHLLIDPAYKFTNKYHLRWKAPRETAYPATFVINSEGEIVFAEVSQSHGGRTNVAAVLETLD